MKSPARNSRGRTSSGSPNPVDVHVGSRVRRRRMLLGLSQEKLAEALGLTFQQVQKYERGGNRIGASRLYDLSRVLDVPVAFFFQDIPEAISQQSPRMLSAGFAEEAVLFEPDPLVRRETMELVRAFSRISDAVIRKRVLELARSLAGEFDQPTHS